MHGRTGRTKGVVPVVRAPRRGRRYRAGPRGPEAQPERDDPQTRFRSRRARDRGTDRQRAPQERLSHHPKAAAEDRPRLQCTFCEFCTSAAVWRWPRCNFLRVLHDRGMEPDDPASSPFNPCAGRGRRRRKSNASDLRKPRSPAPQRHGSLFPSAIAKGPGRSQSSPEAYKSPKKMRRAAFELPMEYKSPKKMHRRKLAGKRQSIRCDRRICALHHPSTTRRGRPILGTISPADTSVVRAEEANLPRRTRQMMVRSAGWERHPTHSADAGVDGREALRRFPSPGRPRRPTANGFGGRQSCIPPRCERAARSRWQKLPRNAWAATRARRRALQPARPHAVSAPRPRSARTGRRRTAPRSRTRAGRQARGPPRRARWRPRR